MTVRLAGSLWSVTSDRVDDEASRLARAGLRRWHWDVSDGSFATPGGFAPRDAARVGTLTGLSGEAHLMVERPVEHLEPWLEVCDTVTVHVESQGWEGAVERIRAAGCDAAVAISPGTPLDALADLPAQIGVLVMSVVPGRAGSGFLPATYDRLDRLAGRTLLGVDGSVDLERGRRCVRHGATWLVSGTALTAVDDPAVWITSVCTPAPG